MTLRTAHIDWTRNGGGRPDLGALALSLALGLAPAWVAVAGEAEDPPPKGYASPEAVLLAIATKRLELIDRDPPLPDGVKIEADIEYGRAGDRPLLLDLYSPERLVKPVPGLIFIHGGAWSGGKRQDYRPYTVHFASKGYVVATVSYRLVPAVFPAQIEDVKCAVRWMRSRAESLRVDPERIAVLGGSAGGHLALLAGYCQDKPELEGKGCNEGISSRVRAVVDFYGPTDLTTPFARKATPVRRLMGGKTFDRAEDLYRLASPLAHVGKDAPPTLIIHGTLDDVVPIDQADSLAARLKDLGVPHEYARLEGWPHTLDLARPVNDWCKRRIEAFLAKHLGEPSKAP